MMACPESKSPTSPIEDTISPSPVAITESPTMSGDQQASLTRLGYMAAMCRDLTQSLSTGEQSAIDVMTNMQQNSHSLSYLSAQYFGDDGGTAPGHGDTPYLQGFQSEHRPRLLPPVSTLTNITHNLPDVPPHSEPVSSADNVTPTFTTTYSDGGVFPAAVSGKDTMDTENVSACSSASDGHRLLSTAPYSAMEHTNRCSDNIEDESMCKPSVARLSREEREELYMYHLENPSHTYEQIAEYLGRRWSRTVMPLTVIMELTSAQESSDAGHSTLQADVNSLNTALCEWVADVTHTDCTISDDILLEKVKQLVTELHIKDFHVTPEWIQEFKHQYGLLNVPSQELKYELESPIKEQFSEESWTDLNDMKTETGPVSDNISDAAEGAQSGGKSNELSGRVTLDEAREGLLNAITYLQTNKQIARGTLKTLKKALKFMNAHARKIESEKAKMLLQQKRLMMPAKPKLVQSTKSTPNRKKAPRSSKKGLLELPDIKLDAENPTKCTFCDKNFVTLYNLRVHMQIHSTTGPLPCVDPDNPKKCSVCGKVYSSINVLRTHQRTHSDVRPYLCNICGAKFVQMSSLHGHMVTHISEKKEKCPVCDKAFTCQRYLKTHLMTHSGERKFMCSLCGVCFLRHSDLRIHSRVHTGYKPYKCGTCDKSFTRFSTFQQHERIHTGAKPYKCPTCDQGFAQPQSLKKHIRIHTGERPFRCAVCDKSFSQSGSLYHHKKTHKQPSAPVVKKENETVCQSARTENETCLTEIKDNT